MYNSQHFNDDEIKFMALSKHSRMEYKKEERQLLIEQITTAQDWRKNYAAHAKEFRQLSKTHSQLNDNIVFADHRFNLLEKLKVLESNLLTSIKNLIITKESHFDEAIFQLLEQLTFLIHTRTCTHNDIIHQYVRCLKLANNQLVAANQLKDTIEKYQYLLSELKKYCSTADLKIHHTDIKPLNNALHDQVYFFKNMILELSPQYNAILEKRGTLSQLLSYQAFLEKSRRDYGSHSIVFYSLANKIIQSRPIIIEKDLMQSLALFSDLKKISSQFNVEIINHYEACEEINLDQKFNQFERHITSIEKNIAKLKDEDIEDYQIIFDKLRLAIEEQLTHERRLLTSTNAYLDKIKISGSLPPKIGKSSLLLEDFIRVLKKKIEFLVTCIEKINIAKNQRTLRILNDAQIEIAEWIDNIPEKIRALDSLILELKNCHSKYISMEERLSQLHVNASLTKFPIYKKLREEIHFLLREINNYKNALHHLAMKIKLQAENFESKFSECKSKMNLHAKKNIFQKISGTLAGEYSEILKAVLQVENKVHACMDFILETQRESKTSFKQEAALCEQLKVKLNTDKIDFAKCYQNCIVDNSDTFQKEQAKILRVNYLLQNIYENLTVIETELHKIHCDTNGITLFKTQFASILINNTVHEEDLEKPVKKYLEWLHFIENTDAIHSHSDEFIKAIKIIRRDLIQVRNELCSWRTGTASYSISTAMRIISPAVFTILAIIIPGAHLLPSALTQNTIFIDQLESATETIVKVGSKQAFEKVANTLSPTKRGAGFDDEDYSENRITNNEPKIFIAGNRRITNNSINDCKLSLDLSYLWQETLYVKIRKALFSKSTVLTGISAPLSLILGLSGVVTPLGLALLMGGVAIGTMSITAYDEYQQRVEEAKVRFQSEKRLLEIEENIRSLARLPERYVFMQYYHSTMDFIREFVTCMTIGKNGQTIHTNLSQMMEYLSKILNVPSSNMQSLNTLDEIDIEVKKQDVEALLIFLKNEAENEDNLMTSIYFLNSPAALTANAKKIESTIINARQHIQKLEHILKTLHENCQISKSPLQKSLDIHYQSKQHRKSARGFFKTKSTCSPKLENILNILVGETTALSNDFSNNFFSN